MSADGGGAAVRGSAAAEEDPAHAQFCALRTTMAGPLEALAEHLSGALPGAVLASEVRHGELTCRIERAALTRVLSFLRDDPQFRFTVLCDVCGADYPDRPERFEVVYNLLSIAHNRRIRIKLSTDEDTPVASAV